MPRHTPQERRKNRRQQRLNDRSRGTKRSSASAVPNPRASGNQAGAARPDSAQQGNQRDLTPNIDESRLRVNQRSVRSGQPTRARTGAMGVQGQTGDTTKSRLNPLNDPNKGNIQKSREARQRGRETVIRDGKVVDTGAGVLEGTGAAAPIATPEQIQRNKRNLQGVAETGLDPVGQAERDAREAVSTGSNARMSPVEKEQFVTERVNQARAKAEGAAASAALARENAARADEAGGVPTPPRESFYESLPPEQQSSAQAAFDPLFDYMEQAQATIDEKEQAGEDAITQIGANLQSYIDTQQARDDTMVSMFNDFYKKQLNNQLDAADATRDAQRRDQELAKQQATFEFNRAIREQMIQNEKERKEQMLGLGVSGGWRSSRHSADVIDALNVGERIVADLHTQKAFMHKDFANRLSDVETQWHSDVVAAHDAYKASSLALFQESQNRAAELDKTVFQTSNDQIKAITDLKTQTIEAQGLLARDMANTTVQRNQFAMQQASAIRKEAIDRENQTWDRAMKHISTFGTQNKAVLGQYEEQLGLMPGSLSSQQTLEELRMKRTGGDGPGSPKDVLTQEYNRLVSIYGEADDRDLYSMAVNNLKKMGYSGKTLRQILQNLPQGVDVLIAEPHGSGKNREDPYEEVEQRLIDASDTQTPEEAENLYREIKGKKSIFFGMGAQSAKDYMSDIGWEITDEVGPGGIEATPKL